ncbi:helix-turn-helix domain-containing protein [Streptomyces triculaminicus]|uniref:Helix-turn-helix domain-containing protein n=1 Tax=Streptomyces triculaminicus TaxID=2816232 RepID=A0A939FIE7_9ACTN|nr:helix-turn-helix domain-containing protein [Streptomyces triculaminicus]
MALAELRQRLNDRLAVSGLNKTQLVRRSGLARTTVWSAFQPDEPAPSARTLAALAKALGLPVEELLEIRRTATAEEAEPTIEEASGPGKPIDQWEPHDLEVHSASTATDGADPPRQRQLPGYVLRAHDRTLAEAVRHAQAGRSRMVVLVGTSSTGKTRACWEAVRPLANAGWRLWHPFDPTRAEAAFDAIERVRPKTVVWLNEAQHYLGDAHVGEQIAAALHALLIDERRMPVLVLGTLWPEYGRQYAAVSAPGQSDPHSRVRELLSGRTVSVPDSFDAEALRAATVLAQSGDRLLADALTRAGNHGRVTQDLAGAPELLRRYEHSSPAARALLEVAMDARRLGVGLHLPQTFLIDAAIDYLTDTDYDNLTDDWAEAAFAELAEPVHGKQAPLRRVTVRPPRRPPHHVAPLSSTPGPVFRLADYLEQHGRETRLLACPPASFWYAAHAKITNPDDLKMLAEAARARHRLQWAHHLMHRAADTGHPDALHRLSTWLEDAGNRQEAEALLRSAADAGDPRALTSLAFQRENEGDLEGAEALAQQAADAGYPRLLALLASWREEDGDRERSEALVRKFADDGDPGALRILAGWRREAGKRQEAEALARQAADAGDSQALALLAAWRREEGDNDGAEALAQQTVDAGDWYALALLAEQREEAGDFEGAEVLARQAADAGAPTALASLVSQREKAGEHERAEALAQQAADAGHCTPLTLLAIRREEAGEHERAEALAKRAAEAGNPNALTFLALRVIEGTGDRAKAEALMQQAADAGDMYAFDFLAHWQEEAGDHEGAEALAWQAAHAGNPNVLARLVSRWERTGDHERAEVLARQAADAGRTDDMGRLLEARWPYGLDPDGAPTAP